MKMDVRGRDAESHRVNTCSMINEEMQYFISYWLPLTLMFASPHSRIGILHSGTHKDRKLLEILYDSEFFIQLGKHVIVCLNAR
jgi:hypothetical protein